MYRAELGLERRDLWGTGTTLIGDWRVADEVLGADQDGLLS